MKNVILFILCIFISGCATQPEIKYVYVDKIVSVGISQTYLDKQQVPKPPDVAEYKSKNYNEKEATLIDYIVELFKYIKLQHNKVDAIDEQIQNFKKTYEVK